MGGEPFDILLVDSDEALAGPMEKCLAELGHRVTAASSAARAVELVDHKPPGLAFVAARTTGDAGGHELVKHLNGQGVPFVLTVPVAGQAGPLIPFHPLAVAIEPPREGELELILSLARDRMMLRRESEERSGILNSIVDGLLDSVLVIDSRRQVMFSNATARRHLQDDALSGKELQQFFPPGGAGNEALFATVSSALSGSGGIDSGARATVRLKSGQTVSVVVIVHSIQDSAGRVTGASISFRPEAGAVEEPANPVEEVQNPESPENPDAADDANGSHPTPFQNTPLRAKAIRSIEAGLNSDSPTHKHYVVVLLLSQFDMFRLRYGLNNAEKLVHAFSAHLIKSLPPEDRLYTWSNRTVVVLLERESTIDEVRLEMTAFCSRRVDYYLNATGRSALVTLSASWHLIPLFDSPDGRRDSRRVIEQIDAFERSHTRRK